MMSSSTTKISPVLLGKWSCYPASTTPNAFDIVWCRFPDSPELKPSPKPRPGLVRRVLRNGDGKIAVEVAYGTSNLKLDRDLRHQLIISQKNDLTEAGLSKPTRFDLTLTKILPWCREFFDELRPGDGSILGRLSAFKRLDLNEMKATLPKPAAQVRRELALAAAQRAGLIPTHEPTNKTAAVTGSRIVPGAAAPNTITPAARKTDPKT
jgi:hypothetical protein